MQNKEKGIKLKGNRFFLGGWGEGGGTINHPSEMQ